MMVAGPVKPRKGGSAKSRAPIRSGGFDTKRFIVQDVLGARPSTQRSVSRTINGKVYKGYVEESGAANIAGGLLKIAASALRGSGKAAAPAVSTAKSLGATTVRGRQTAKFGPRKPTSTQAQKAAAGRATWSAANAPNYVVGRGALSSRVLNSPGARQVRGNRIAAQAVGGKKAGAASVAKTVGGMARESARGTGQSVRAAGGTVSAGVKSAPKSVKYGVGAGAAGTALYYTGRATSGDKKSGYVPMTSRTKKMQGYVPMTVPSSAVAVVKSRSTAGYVPNVPSSPRKKLTPSTPTVEKPKTTKKPGGGTKTTIGGGQVPGRRPGTSVRTAAVQKRLSLAAEEAAKGNSAAAAAYANAALNIQKKGKGSAASMKKVQKVAAAYAKAAKK